MINISIKKEEDIKELENQYSLDFHSNLVSFFRELIEVCMQKDDEVIIEFPVDILSSAYQSVPYLLPKQILKTNVLNCFVDISRKGTTCFLRASYVPKGKTFMSKLIAKLQTPKLKSVNITFRDMPAGYSQQPYVLMNRLKNKGIPCKLEKIPSPDGTIFKITKKETTK